MTAASRQRPTTDSMRTQLPPELVDRTGCPFDPAAGVTDLSARGPVHQVTATNGEVVWLVTGHDEARAVLSDPRMSADRFRNPRLLARVPQEMREQLLSPKARAGGFIAMDAPEHTRYRRLLTGQFTVRRMRMLTPRIHEIVTDRLDAMIAAGPPADLVRDFALPVPSLVICELLGVPYDDRDSFQHRTAQLLNLETPLEQLIEARDELRAYMIGLVRSKREHPADDLLSGLIQDGDLDDDELAGVANLLLVAGHETTANMLGLGTFALLEHPDQLAKLRADPSLAEGAVEELLRYLSIIHMGPFRFATAEVELGGVVIPADSTVIISVPAVNRDAEQFPDPGALAVDRPRGHHLSFGHGIHQCLGQQLARVEMAVGFTELLRRLPGLRLDVPARQVPTRDTMVVFGVHSLPVSWDA
ncbi:cytochrome P450 [Lentzea tibetensis]|uniref:Cytochrome P450 n=1 Tax=Lentzea tibetensis TaxID=2591470 RepID=A0A563ET13_9PSEU|nr:cytochrome P450 [Lentzea tibetensis]TWP50742.1 cytochrome P450 [Lentzea tibetensis]